MSGHASVSSAVPIARFSEEEKKVSVIKAPHYEGIGPVDESGIPIAIRTVSVFMQRAERVGLSQISVALHRSVFGLISVSVLVCDQAQERGLLSTVSSF